MSFRVSIDNGYDPSDPITVINCKRCGEGVDDDGPVGGAAIAAFRRLHECETQL